MKLSKYLFGSLDFCIEKLQQQEVIAYPTEAVFGLGCDPDSESAILALLKLKHRSTKKGFILIGSNYKQLEPYVDTSKLTLAQQAYMFSNWPGHITFVVPASSRALHWFIGSSNSIAIRVSNHPHVKDLCFGFGKPIISTSANFSGTEPCRNVREIKQQFGINFPVLHAVTGGHSKPSEIRNVISGELIRQG